MYNSDKVDEMRESVKEWSRDQSIIDHHEVKIRYDFNKYVSLKDLKSADLYGSWLSTYYFGQGVAALITDQERGGELIERGIVYSFCCQIAMDQFYKNDPDCLLVGDFVLWSYCMFYSILSDNNIFASWFAKKMLEEINSKRFRESDCINSDYYWFVYCLTSLYLGEDNITDKVLEKCGVYKGLLSGGNELEHEIIKTLDFHLDESYGVENEEREMLLFMDKFALVFPLEVLAFIKIKDINNIDYSIHPLLEVANKPIRKFVMPEIDDDLALFIREAKVQYDLDFLGIL